MAFWNQNRRKRAAQVLLTFFLMCISISLLFVAMSLPQWSHTHPQSSITGNAGNIETGAGRRGSARATTPTVVVQITQGPQTKPTGTVIVPSQVTPTPSSSASSCTTPDAQVNVNGTTSTNIALLRTTPYAPNTPIAQNTSPVVHSTATPSATTTPVPTTVATATITPTATQQVTPTETATATPSVTPATTPTVTGASETPPPVSPQQQDGGGPLNDGTPVSASPVPGSTPPGSTQHIGGGWISACNGNDIGMIAGANVVEVVWQHLWLILGASLMCTALFYGILWHVNKNRT